MIVVLCGGGLAQDKSKIFMAKYFCVRLHVAFGMALAISICLGKGGTSI